MKTDYKKLILGVLALSVCSPVVAQNNKKVKTTFQTSREWKATIDGDHYRLTFDKPGTWSQKYNLVWDKVLGLNIFDPKIAETEIAYYLNKMNTYGLPLDSRETYTKTDWVMWTAALSDNQATFRKFVTPMHKFMNETIDRVPMSDWVFTDKPNYRGFKARSVVGGYYLRMLENRLLAE